MACAIDDTLSNMFEDLEIETMGLVTRSQKGKSQLSLQGNYYRILSFQAKYVEKDPRTWLGRDLQKQSRS